MSLAASYNATSKGWGPLRVDCISLEQIYVITNVVDVTINLLSGKVETTKFLYKHDYSTRHMGKGGGLFNTEMYQQ